MNEIAGARSDLERPSPYVDRRALSEAWYRALFDARHVQGERGGARIAAPANEVVPAAHRATSAGSRAEPISQRAPARAARHRLLRSAFASDVRVRGGKAPAAVALRAALQRALWRRTSCRATLPAGRAVDLLVQQRGDLLRLVAMYDGRDAGCVSAALLRARAALLQRGLRVELDARQKGTS